METPKVCLGCFKEWEEEHTACPHCGWEPGKKNDAIFGWTTANVFEKRYLLGMLYCRIPDAAVWRIYDNLLGISCFALRTTSQNTDSMYLLAERIQRLEYLTGDPVKILAVKNIDKKCVLLFSMKDSNRSPEALQAVLRAKCIISENVPAISEEPETDQKKEQVLRNGTLLDSRYRILDCIGIGGFGIIYLCQDLQLQRLAAVKEYFPQEWAERDEQYVDVKKSQMVEAFRYGLQSFYKEARIMAKFIHTPHVVTLYDLMEANDTVYLVMEYITGTSIGREMRARNYQPYEPKEMVNMLLPVMDALEALHEEKIIHSDISPGNIMRSEKNEVFLIDMGAAKYALDSQPALSAAFLKLDYAAPEQYRTAQEGIPKDEGPWTDVYALGATMYYLLTGQKPMDVMQRLSGEQADVVLPESCKLQQAEQWTQLLNHAMALEIKERIRSVDKLKKEVMRIVE